MGRLRKWEVSKKKKFKTEDNSIVKFGNDSTIKRKRLMQSLKKTSLKRGEASFSDTWKDL